MGRHGPVKFVGLTRRHGLTKRPMDRALGRRRGMGTPQARPVRHGAISGRRAGLARPDGHIYLEVHDERHGQPGQKLPVAGLLYLRMLPAVV